MTEWQHELEFRRLMRQCLSSRRGNGISRCDFDRLVAMTASAPPEMQDKISVWIARMAEHEDA
jgi:hypothetical protein